MRAINHALTGAFIGLVVQQPAVAIPAALLSHFICDVIPHHGDTAQTEKEKQHLLRSLRFRYQLMLDAALCFILVVLLFVFAHSVWLLVSICAFAAAAPDFLWVRRYIASIRHKPWRPTPIDVIAGRIQWFQRPIGAVVEVAWFIGLGLLVLPFLHK